MKIRVQAKPSWDPTIGLGEMPIEVQNQIIGSELAVRKQTANGNYEISPLELIISLSKAGKEEATSYFRGIIEFHMRFNGFSIEMDKDDCIVIE